MEKVKSMFHENITATTEINGGKWDAAKNTYFVTDAASGVTTEYKLKKNAYLQTGLGATAHSYKELPDPSTGGTKKVEVTFDAKTESWVKKSALAKAKDAMSPRPKLMATLTEVKSADGKGSEHTLVVAPTKLKDRGRAPIVLVMPRGPVGNNSGVA